LEAVQNNRSLPVIPYQSPDKELAFWQQHFQSETSLIDTFSTIMQHSIKVHHPRCIGHQVAAPSPIGSLAGLLSDLLSNGTGVYEMGIASNAMEKVITDFMTAAIGYPSNASGLLTSGGTLANLTALLAARKAKAPGDVWQNGQEEKLAVMVSEEAHYCIERAAKIMGLGEGGIIKVPVDQHFKIRTDLLAAYYEKAKSAGYHVIALIGCASTTATGSYDDLAILADFCEQHNLWFHIDGAHGGGVVFSKKYAPLAKGIEQADSIAIDFHKMLLTPTLTTALLFKDGSDVYKTFAQKAQYLWDVPQSEEWYNSGKRTFECTKLMMSAKVYMVLKAHGTAVFEQNITHLYDMARILAKQIDTRNDFELVIAPESNIVNFRYIPNTDIDLNRLNSSIRQQLLEDGNFYIVQTIISDKRYLRCTIMNPLSTPTDFQDLLDEIERIGKELVAAALQKSPTLL
jgi:L-2,4-diaminobutyrate decarboxylase